MKTHLIILGCGSSLGVPRADGYWGLCDRKNLKNYMILCLNLIKYAVISCNCT